MRPSLLAAGVCALTLPALFAQNLPRKAPELAINLPAHKQVLLSAYRGRVAVVAFILTSCPHCQKTTGLLARLQHELGPGNLQVLESAIEDMAAYDIGDFIKRFNPPFPVGYNDRNTVLEFLQHSSVLPMLMPQLVFVDRQGMIRAQYAGDDAFFNDDQQENNIRKKVLELLKDSTPPAAAKKPAPPRKKTVD